MKPKKILAILAAIVAVIILVGNIKSSPLALESQAAEMESSQCSSATQEHTFVKSSDENHTCSVCGATYSHTVVVDAVAVEATCTEPGHTESSHCSVCQEPIVAQEVILATGHDCDSDGICKVCSKVIIITGNCGNGVNYTLNVTTGKLTIIGTGTINRNAFRENLLIKTVEFQDGITNIGEYAFYGCTNLVSIIIPMSIEDIDDNAFNGCSNLTSIYAAGLYREFSNKDAVSNREDDTISYTDRLNHLFGGITILYSDSFKASLALDGTLKVNIKCTRGAPYDLTGCTINGEAVTVDANHCATIDVAPKDYNQNIEIKYYDVQVKLFSVADMIYYYKQSKDTKAIAEKLDAYCSAAEAYFGTGTVADYESSWETVKTATSNHTVTMGDNYYGSSLVLNSGTILRHYYTVDFADKTGTKNGYFYKDEMIPAHQYAMGNASDGTYCVNDYIYRALNNESSTPDLKNLCVALYNYGVAAKTYSNAVANGGSN